MTKDKITTELYNLIGDHLEGVGFIIAALHKAMDGGLTDEQRARFVDEIAAMELRNIEIRRAIQ